ncbi:MAG: protease [Bacteroidetes bacterium]|nr:protease [Bacteroidota bacterium]
MNKVSVLLFLIVVSITSAIAQEEARLMRFPSIHGNQVVFSYAGDLFSANTQDGQAKKLTNHVGYEMFAHFSPDGKNIAFTGEYDGNREVYVISAKGGVPKRLTYTATLGRDDISDRMGPNNIVMAWKDNVTIVFRSRMKSYNAFVGQLFEVNINQGLQKQLELPRGGFCSFSPNGEKMAYNRVFREFRTWKYYEGGMADDVWIYDFKSKSTENITSNKAQDIFPMWYKNKVYYLSDRNRTMNLFVYDMTDKTTKQITEFTNYDVKFPSLGDKAIVFENGGFIYTYDLQSLKLNKLKIIIHDDLIYSRDEIVDASKFMRGIEMSPDAKRLVATARGDVFSIPAEKGITLNLTKSSGAHDRNAIWSPDGKYIAYISDVSGENEIYILAQDGSQDPVALTKGGGSYKYHISWSPDSKKILWADKELQLQYVDIDSKKIKVVDKAQAWEFSNYNWSPDSKWIAYSRYEVSSMSNIYIYSLDDDKKQVVTDGWYNSGSAKFSNDGKYLFFTSARDFNPTYSWTEWNHAYVDMSKMYFVTLSKETPSPFEPTNDQVTMKEDTDKKSESEEKEDVMKVDLEDIQQRILAIPTDAGNYYGINCIDGVVYYVKRKQGSKASLNMYDLEKQKETELGEYNSYDVSVDGKKMLIRKGRDYYIIALAKSKINLSEGKVNLADMKVRVNKEEEWMQIYNEAWRQMRDFFYDPNMHGTNWAALKSKYGSLVPFVKHRDDLNYLIGELIGELSVGHAYVSGGDKPKAERIQMGLLGAELANHSSGYYQINKILKGQNWDKSMRSPLTELGLNIQEGDFILAVNGESTKLMQNIFASLIGSANKQVELTVNSKAELAGSRKVIVIPISDESKLYYYNWVQENIEKVNKATNGKVGYIHIPDMGVAGLNEFVKYFYPQLSKKALIIDDRGNGGGNVSPMIIERLRREMARANMARNTTKTATPKQMLHGPKVCLINEYSASDGDLFPYQFRKYELGKLIGKRSWGGVVGIRGSLPFIDGASLNKPEFSTYDENGWIIEGYGVDPDIYVDNDPAKEYAGIDEQLNKAIEVILEELKNNPQEIPDIPKFPLKNK